MYRMRTAAILFLSLIAPMSFTGLMPNTYSYGLVSTNNSVDKQTIVVHGPMPEVIRDDIVLRLDPIYPVDDPNTVSSNYGYRSLSNCNKCSRYHNGVDYQQSPTNRNVYSIMDGRISQVKHQGEYGLHVIVQHVIYPDELVYSTIYAHLRQSSVTKSLSIGDKVEKGQLLGYIGQTGLATGPHLHFEVLRNGQNMDPNRFFAKHMQLEAN